MRFFSVFLTSLFLLSPSTVFALYAASADGSCACKPSDITGSSMVALDHEGNVVDHSGDIVIGADELYGFSDAQVQELIIDSEAEGNTVTNTLTNDKCSDKTKRNKCLRGSLAFCEYSYEIKDADGNVIETGETSVGCKWVTSTTKSADGSIDMVGGIF